MKAALIIILLLLAAVPGSAQNGFLYEVGLAVGEPTGLSAKMWLTENTAFEAFAGASWVPDPVPQIHIDILRHDFDFLESIAEGQFPLLYGLGGVVQFRDERLVGIRVPFGLEYLFDVMPLSAFIHVAPRIDISPEAGVSINSAVGLRYVFGR